MKSTKAGHQSIGTALLALTLMAASSCGSSSLGAAGGSPADAFVGIWSFTTGTIVPGCPASLNVSNIALTGYTATISKVDGTHVTMAVSTPDVMCNVSFSVSGSTASAELPQTCMISASGQSASVNVSAWTLSESGSTITMSMSGTANVVIVMCSPTASGTLTKSSGADGGAAG